MNPIGVVNPFFFKSHALLSATLVVLTGAVSLNVRVALILVLTYLCANLPFAACFAVAARRSAGLRLPFHKIFLLSLPATLAYLPVGVTLVDDVMHQRFQLDDRYLFLFAIMVATLMLAGFYGAVVHYRGGQPIGSEHGLVLALALLLAMLPIALLLLGLDEWLEFVPRIRPAA